MPDLGFIDVSKYNKPLDDDYDGEFVIIRSGDGTIRDELFGRNFRWCNAAVRADRIVGFGVYHVWRPTGDHGLSTLLDLIGPVHRPRMMIEWDIESWGGQIAGDHSAAIAGTIRATVTALNALRPANQRKWWCRAFYREMDRRRVRLYANGGDYAAICPHATRRMIRLANYDTNPGKPRHWAHQYSSTGRWGKWRPVDINSADGYSWSKLARRLGFLTIDLQVPHDRP